MCAPLSVKGLELLNEDLQNGVEYVFNNFLKIKHLINK